VDTREELLVRIIRRRCPHKKINSDEQHAIFAHDAKCTEVDCGIFERYCEL